MEIERIRHLEMLAGLRLSDPERQALLRDLAVLDRRADQALEGAGLLSVPVPESGPSAGPPGPPLPDLDLEQVALNAPDFAGGFFRLPAVDTTEEPEAG